MKEIHMNRNRYLICFIFLLGISLSAVTSSAQDAVPVPWVTSKAEAVSKALSEGKYILLLAGASWCKHCYAMRYDICEEKDPAYPIKSVILDNYVPWFIDVDLSSEWRTYAPGPDYYIPSTSRIDPRNPDSYMDQYYGDYGYYSDPNLAKATFYNRLLNGLGDIDSDGMPDAWERLHGLDVLFDDASNDLDEDDLSNIDEYNSGTIPNNSDSDGDSMPDGWEVQCGLNPLVNDAEDDLDNDRFSNLKEYQKGTLPNDRSSRPKTGMPWLPLLLED